MSNWWTVAAVTTGVGIGCAFVFYVTLNSNDIRERLLADVYRQASNSIHESGPLGITVPRGLLQQA